MEHVVVDGPQWGIEFDEPLYSLKDWGSVSSYIDHGDGDDSDAGVNGATSARNGSGDDSALKGAVSPCDGNGVAEARASAEASGSGSEGVGDSLEVGGSEAAHGANCDGNGVRNDDEVARTSIRGDGLCRSNHAAEEDVNFDSKTNQNDRSDDEIDSIRDELEGVNCAEDVNFHPKTNEHDREDDLEGVYCAEGPEQDVNFDSKTNEHDREDDNGVNCAEDAEQEVNFDSKTNQHDREDDLKGLNCAEGAEQDVNFDSKTNEDARSDDAIDSIRDELNGVNCAEGAEGGRDVNLNAEHDRQSDGTAEPRICAQTGNDDIGERIVDSQKDEVIPDTEEHNEFGISEDGFLTLKPLKVAPPPRKRARIQQKENKENEKGKEKQAKKQKAKGKKAKAKVEKDGEGDTNQCEICKKKFKNGWRLREHRIVHSNEKQFVCDFPGCDSKYKRKSDLNIHMANHAGRKRPR